jgi:TatA/E family protein of Tat protein translocase
MSAGQWEIVLANLVIIIFFGGKKMPELACRIGKSLTEFKKQEKNYRRCEFDCR